MDAPDLDDARKRYHFAFAPEDFERLPFYSALIRSMEHDDLAIELLASVRVEQRNPMLILATLQLAALCGHHVLEPIYDEARHGSLEDPQQAVRDVLAVLHESPELVRDELWRSTQTNEPGRSAVLQAVIRDIVHDVPGSIDVIEVGTSAGINLRFDQFTVRAVDDDDPLTLICEDLSPIDRSTPLPKVGARVGIDPHPLRIDTDDDRRWLKACLWPEERRRHDRFDAIVAAFPSWPAVTMLQGRALDRMNDAFLLTDPDTLTVVMNTWVVFYLSEEERRAYYDELTRRCRVDDVAWISIESTLIEWPGVARDEAQHHRGASQIMVTRPGEAPSLWGWCHAHGRWLERITSS